MPAAVRKLSHAPDPIQLPLTAENLQAIDATACPERNSLGGVQAVANVELGEPCPLYIGSKSPASSQKMTRRQRQRMNKLASFPFSPARIPTGTKQNICPLCSSRNGTKRLRVPVKMARTVIEDSEGYIDKRLREG